MALTRPKFEGLTYLDDIVASAGLWRTLYNCVKVWLERYLTRVPRWYVGNHYDGDKLPSTIGSKLYLGFKVASERARTDHVLSCKPVKEVDVVKNFYRQLLSLSNKNE